MHSVSRFESDLLKILYGLLEKAPASQTLPLVLKSFSGRKPKCLSRTCVDLIQDALRKGCVSLLTKWGGWRNEAFLRNETIKKGRIWERTSPENLGLTFSAATLDFLIWLTRTEIVTGNATWTPQKLNTVTVGDQFFFFLALKLLNNKLAASRLCGSKVFSQNGLVCLAFPDQFANTSRTMQPDFGPWVTGTGGAIIEMMQAPLVEFWTAAESHKPFITDRRKMLKLGQAQKLVLDNFVRVAAEAGRVDLFRFMLAMMQQMATANRQSKHWTKSLNVKNMRVADRTQIYLAALAVPVAAKHLAEQQKQNLGVSFVDDNYEASQLWKMNWEALNGPESVLQAERIVGEVSF